MPVWSVVNQKGGVGKTTTALTLAGIAAARGQRVILIDLDPHSSLTSFFRFNPDELEGSTFNAVFNTPQFSEFSLRQNLLASGTDNLKLMAGSPALATIDRKPSGADGMGRSLSLACGMLKPAADLIIIDGPPMAGMLMVNAILAADRLILPVQTEFFALQGLERMLVTLDQLESLDPDFKADYLIVPTLYDRRTHAAQVSLTSLREQHGPRVWDGAIALDTKFRESCASGVLPHRLAEECFGAAAYGMLLDELLRPRQQSEHERSRA